MARSANEAVLGIALVAVGCNDPSKDESTSETDGGDFELVSGEIDPAGQVVTLHFSKPVAALDEVPPDNFRISHAAPTEVCGDNGCEPETTYWDPNFYVEYRLSYYDPDPTASFMVTSISLGDDAHDIRLQFGTPLNPAFCQHVTTNLVNEPSYSALLVHYEPDHISLDSVDGEPLEVIGPQWVEHGSNVMSTPGEFLEHLDPRVEIPCP